MIERFTTHQRFIAAVGILSALALQLSGCSKDKDVIPERECWTFTHNISGSTAEDIRGHLLQKAKKGKLPEGLEGLYGLAETADNARDILTEMHAEEGKNKYSEGPSPLDKYGVCVEVDGGIHVENSRFKTEEQRVREAY